MMKRVKEIKINQCAFQQLGLSSPTELYAIISEDNFVMNGWIEISQEVKEKINNKKIKIEAALCDAEGGIIDRDTSFKDINQVYELGYSAFTIFMGSVNRYCQIEDIEYVKIYPVLTE